MTGLAAPAPSAGDAIAGAIIPGAAAGVPAGGGGTAGGAAGGGTAGGAANGAPNCATADPTCGRMTVMPMITAAAPAAMIQTSVSVLLLLPKVLKQPMPVRELIWVKNLKVQLYYKAL